MSLKSAIKCCSKQQTTKNTVRFSEEGDKVEYTWAGYKKKKYRKPTNVEINYPKKLVHSSVRVTWKFMSGRRDEWFKGTIDTYNKITRQLYITYDDGCKRWYYITSNICGVPVVKEDFNGDYPGKAIQIIDEEASQGDSDIYDRRHDAAKSKYQKNKQVILDKIYRHNPGMWHKIINKSDERVNSINRHSKKILSSTNT